MTVQDAVEQPMAVRLARAECQARLEAGHPMRAVEAYIDELPVSDELREALWMWAWSYGERVPPR